MRLADYLALVLHAQGQTLTRLAAFFGEERFFEILENNETPPPPFPADVITKEYWKEAPGSDASAYAELESVVREMNLPEFFEFHLWAYPWYRHFIESGLPLRGTLRTEDPVSDERIEKLLQATLHAQDAWFRSLHLPLVVAPVAEKAAQNPWLRFRGDFMKKLGRKPFGLASV